MKFSRILLLLVGSFAITLSSMGQVYQEADVYIGDIKSSCYKLSASSEWTQWRKNEVTIAAKNDAGVDFDKVRWIIDDKRSNSSKYWFLDNLDVVKSDLVRARVLSHRKDWETARNSFLNYMERYGGLTSINLPSFMKYLELNFKEEGHNDKDYSFKFRTNNYAIPNRNEIDTALETNGWLKYTGTFTYYVNDEYPSLAMQIEKFGHPCVTKWRGKEITEEVRFSVSASFWERLALFESPLELCINIHFQNGFSYAISIHVWNYFVNGRQNIIYNNIRYIYRGGWESLVLQILKDF